MFAEVRFLLLNGTRLKQTAKIFAQPSCRVKSVYDLLSLEMASLKPEDAESGKHARMSSLAMAHSFSAVSEDGDDGKEENPFKSMEEDVGKMISNVEVIHKIGQKNFKNVVNLINSTFDEMQKTIDEQRKELLKMAS